MSKIVTCLMLGTVALAQYNAPVVIATLRVPGLTESSGLAASRAYPGVFWSHNDSGADPYIYAFDRTGKNLGRWRVRNGKVRDWEDIAIGPAPKGGWFIYIGDIGNNLRRRKEMTIYRVAEPNPGMGGRTTSAVETIRLKYPDEPHDAECLLVHPKTGDIYVVTKARGTDTATIVYKVEAPYSLSRLNNLRRIASLDLPDSPLTLLIGRVTGGDISPEGDRVILSGYFQGWEARLRGSANRFDEIWKEPWTNVQLGARTQGEAVCYRHDGQAVLSTSEGRDSPLIEALRAQ